MPGLVTANPEYGEQHKQEQQIHRRATERTPCCPGMSMPLHADSINVFAAPTTNEKPGGVGPPKCFLATTQIGRHAMAYFMQPNRGIQDRDRENECRPYLYLHDRAKLTLS